jgi:hypothetical protein
VYRFNIVMLSGDKDRPTVAALDGTSGDRDDGRERRFFENRIYHTVFYDNYDLAFTLGIRSSDATYGNNKFKNNILFGHPTDGATGAAVIEYHLDDKYPSPKGEEWEGNLIENGSRKVLSMRWQRKSYTVTEADAASGSALLRGVQFANNISASPMFVDAAGRDFRVQAGSPAIDRGVFLTTTTSSGSGTQVEVRDARYFIDGFGIVEGDRIQIGREVVRVTNADYRRNVLTVDRSIGWRAGEGVSFPYSGNRPDIGRHQYNVQARLAAPTGLRLCEVVDGTVRCWAQ